MSSDKVSVKLRAKVAERAKFCCEYCRSQGRFSPDSFSVDHIVPVAKKGTNKLSNLAFACQGCNNTKYASTQAFDTATQTTVSLFHPRSHQWGKHLAWNESYREIIGITATGRATVERLRLNRSGLLNLREILQDAGKHPPSF